MTFFYETIASDLFHRFGWVLLHSVWQFALIGTVLAIALGILRRRSAAMRYVVCCVALCGTLAASVVTFTLVPGSTSDQVAVVVSESPPPTIEPIEPIETEPTEPIEPVPAEIDVSFVPIDATDTEPPAVASEITNVFPTPNVQERTVAAPPRTKPWAASIRPWLPGVSLAWLGGVVLFSLWNIGGWLGVARLRRVGVEPVGEELADRVAALAERMRLRQSVRVLHSALVEIPVVLGWWRPVLLLPVAILTGLSPRQLDAVLAHELAHIRRHDYLVNLLQTVVETLLFYHPAVWWISRQTRIQREHCCDDVAVGVCGDSVEYAMALASFEETRSAPRPAMAANEGNTLARVRRILGVSARQGRLTKSLAGSMAVVALVAVAIACSVWSGGVEKPARAEEPEQTGTDSAKDELFKTLFNPAVFPWWYIGETYQSRADRVVALLREGADVNGRNDAGQTPLDAAVRASGKDEVAALLEHGADPNLPDTEGYAPLHHAVRPSGHIHAREILDLLLTHKADVDAKGKNGFTPLHVAADSGNHAVIPFLVEHGANLEAGDKFGWTPLHRGALNAKVVQALLNCGANVDAKTPKFGYTALQLATKPRMGEDRTDVVRVIKAHQARLAATFVKLEVVQYWGDEDRHFPDGRTLTIEDAAEIERWTAFFPDVGKGKESDVAGGWESEVIMLFHRKDKSTLRVTTDFEDWSEGDGDWTVRGDLSGFVEKQFTEALSRARRELTEHARLMLKADAGIAQQPTGLDLSKLLELSGQKKDFQAFTNDHRYFERDVKRHVEGKKTWALCSLLDHENVDAKIHTARGLLQLADPDSAPVLLAAAKRNNYVVSGSEGATLHSIYRGTLKKALEKITGKQLTPAGLTVTTYPTPGKPKVIRSEDDPSYFTEAVDFGQVEDWLKTRDPITGSRKAPTVPNDWGSTVNGLQAGLDLERPARGAKRNLRLLFRLRNAGDKPVRVLRLSAQARFWGENLPIEVVDMRDQRKVMKYGGPVLEPPPPPSSQEYVHLASGEIDSVEVEMNPAHWSIKDLSKVHAAFLFSNANEKEDPGPPLQPITGLWTGRVMSPRVPLAPGNPKKPEVPKSADTPPADQIASKWGSAVEGVRCRLRSDRPVWKHGDIPTFKIDIHNDGPKTWALPPSQPLYEIEVDGRWFTWSGSIDVESPFVGPGKGLTNISLQANGDLFKHLDGTAGKTTHVPLTLSRGRHVVRVACSPDPQDSTKDKPIRVVSNPVEIDVVEFAKGQPKRAKRQPKVEYLIDASPGELFRGGVYAKEVPLASWFERLGLDDPDFSSDTDTWLLMRGKTLNTHDRIWIDRIERDGNRIVIRATCATGRFYGYARDEPFRPYFAVNLGKLPADKYEAEWHISSTSFEKPEFDATDRPKDPLPVNGPVQVVKTSFVVTPQTPEQTTPGRSKPGLGLMGRLVVAKPTITTAEHFDLSLELRNLNKAGGSGLAVQTGNPFLFEVQVINAQGKPVIPTISRDVLISPKWSVIRPFKEENFTTIPVTFQNTNVAKDTQLDIRTYAWNLPPGKYKIAATYTSPKEIRYKGEATPWRGKLELPPVDVEVTAEDKLKTASAYVMLCTVLDESPTGSGTNVQKSYKVKYTVLHNGLPGDDLVDEIWLHYDSSDYPSELRSGKEGSWHKNDRFIAFVDHDDSTQRPDDFRFRIVRTDDPKSGLSRVASMYGPEAAAIVKAKESDGSDGDPLNTISRTLRRLANQHLPGHEFGVNEAGHIRIAWKTQSYDVPRPAAKSGDSKVVIRKETGPSPDGLILTVWITDQPGQARRPQTLDNGVSWKTYLGEHILSGDRTRLMLNLDYGPKTDKKLIEDFSSPKRWLVGNTSATEMPEGIEQLRDVERPVFSDATRNILRMFSERDLIGLQKSRPGSLDGLPGNERNTIALVAAKSLDIDRYMAAAGIDDVPGHFTKPTTQDTPAEGECRRQWGVNMCAADMLQHLAEKRLIDDPRVLPYLIKALDHPDRSSVGRKCFIALTHLTRRETGRLYWSRLIADKERHGEITSWWKKWLEKSEDRHPIFDAETEEIARTAFLEVAKTIEKDLKPRHPELTLFMVPKTIRPSWDQPMFALTYEPHLLANPIQGDNLPRGDSRLQLSIVCRFLSPDLPRRGNAPSSNARKNMEVCHRREIGRCDLVIEVLASTTNAALIADLKNVFANGAVTAGRTASSIGPPADSEPTGGPNDAMKDLLAPLQEHRKDRQPITKQQPTFLSNLTSEAKEPRTTPRQPLPSTKADLARLTFADPLVQRRFESFNKFAESRAENDWHRRPYQTFPNRPVPTAYFAEWATFANKDGRNPLNYHGPDECHSLGCSAKLEPQNHNRIVGIGLWCRWKPADKGWSARIEYRTSNERPVLDGRPREKFSMHFLHYPRLDDPDLGRNDIMIDREGNADYQADFIVDDQMYDIIVNTWDHARNARLKGKQPDTEIRRIMATPESFRDYCLDVLERLAKKIETDFADGSAIKSARKMRMPAANEDPDSLYTGRRMTAKEKESCLVRARADTQARIRLIKKHYRGMYAAANKALPMLELTNDP